MQLLIIRHGDPDYAADGLTPKGHREAALLAEYLQNRPIDDYYVSPLGRARATARYTLEKKGAEAEVLDWLREFPAVVRTGELPELEEALPPWEDDPRSEHLCWDILPRYWMEREEFFHPEDWRRTELCRHSDMEQVYARVTGSFDRLLERYGYFRQGRLYRAEPGSHKVAALFCHFGVECVLLAHLIGMNTFVLWHCTCALPSAVTWVNTEERRQGVASWRMASFGDLSHLALGGEEPSFSARFCECFGDETRH